MTQEHGLREEERRLVTVLFADLVGYTAVSEARDPELIQEALNLCFGRLSHEITRFGGYVDKVVGDEIMALFGAPKAQEDDAGKAVAAALAMRHALEELTPQLQGRLGQGFSIRIGINTGLVVTGAVGPGGYTVTGDAVNVAARLEKAGDPGEIVVGDATRRLARRPFRWGQRQELTVKGRTESVVCYKVEGAAAAALQLVPAPSDTPFVGRLDHIERVRALWGEAASTGRSRVLQLVGESGIGKTRLLAHLFADVQASPEQVLYTRADTPPRTFGPLLQLLPSLRNTLPAGFEERIEALAAVHEQAELPEVEPGWLLDGLADVIARLAAGRPVALVLDDMHRADRATVDIVDKLLPRLQSLPVLTLLLRQPTGRRPRRVSEEETVTLEPLSREQSAALAMSAAPRLSEAARQQIVDRAGGNPLYLELLAAAAMATPDVAAVPESLQTAVVARVDELDETSRRVLREASVFGQSFYEEPLKLTTTISGGLYETLGHLCEIGLLSELPDARYRGYQFRHSLVQEVVYQGLLMRQRVELHRRAAEALELAREEGMDVEPEQLAFHYQEAGDIERGAAYHLAAAERADHLRAPADASAHRRAANRLLNMASLAGLYSTHGRPSAVARALAAGIQALIAALLVLPVFLLFSMRRPEADVLTLGLPFEIIDFNPSAVLLAVVLGGAPLLVAGIVFGHLAVPVLMRRQVSPVTFVAVAVGGWALGLAFVLIGYAALIGLLRLGALDRLSSMYVGGATLRMLLGDYSLAVSAVIGTLVVSLVWTALLRLQTRGWARLRRSAAGPKEIEEGRRMAALRQLGTLGAIVGALAVGLLVMYQVGLLPHGDAQAGMGAAAFGGLVLPFAALGVGGGSAAWFAGKRLRTGKGAEQLGLFGFEVPLVLALAFGLVIWFGMRQAVIVAANDVDTPGDVSAFNRAVNLFPDLGMAYYLRGERYLAQDDVELARADFDRAAELDPEFPATYLARGRVLIELGEYEAAAADGSRLIDLRPEHPGGYAIRAWARSELGDTAGAAQDIALATRPLPEDAQAWDAFFVRCGALKAIGRLDEAEADCLRAIDLNPGHIVSLDFLLQIEDIRGSEATSQEEQDLHYGKVIEYATGILDVQPENAVAYVNRGIGYQQLERFGESEADLTRATEIDPNDPIAHQERGLTLLYLDRPDEALADLNQAVGLYEQDPNAATIDPGGLYATRLFVALYSGEYDLVIADAAKLEELDEETPWVLSNRGLAHLEQAELQQGMAEIDRALALDPDDGFAHDRRGYALFLLRDYAQAEQELETALDRLPFLDDEQRAELHYHRALLFRAQGRSGLALAEIEEAAELARVPSVRRQIESVQSSLQ